MKEYEIIINIKGEQASGKTFIFNKISKFLQNEGFEIKKQHLDKKNFDPHLIVIVNKF